MPFSIAGNRLKAEGAKILAEVLRVNSAMKKIKVNNCELPIDTLKNGTEVDLSGQGLIVGDVIIIAACISVSSSMTSLK